MALNLDSSAFKDMVLVLGATGLVIPAFAALRISPVIGFILIGCWTVAQYYRGA